MRHQVIDIIGLHVSEEDIPETIRRVIRKAHVLVGGKRHIAQFGDFAGKTLPITGEIDALLKEIDLCRKDGLRVAVVATGDPLLFGIGNTLVEHFGRDGVRVHPGVSAVQAALSRLGLSTSDAVAISRHGRRRDDLRRALFHSVAVILTSGDSGPAEIAKEMTGLIPDAGAWTAHVCQRLGTEDETVESGTLATLRGRENFLSPNLIVVENPIPMAPLTASADFGRPDADYDHEANLITHAEVRAVVLAKLRLNGAHTLWDVGAGSGSVGIEAAGLNPLLSVFSVEKNEERIRRIQANAKAHGVDRRLTAVSGHAMDVCPRLPAPDRVFIGGGGKDLPDLLDLCYGRLAEGGVLVVNTVTLESGEAAHGFFRKKNLDVEVLSMQISRLRPLAGYHAMKPDNPITLFGMRK